MRHFSVLDISLYQIQMFLTVAELRNFSRAATRMHVTQPTLSKRIAILEDTIGVRLFQRDKRPVELTPAGEVLWQEWRGIYRRFEDSIEKALNIHERAARKLTVSTVDSTRHLLAIHLAGQQLEHDFSGLAFSWEYNSFMKWRNKLHDYAIDIMLTVKLEEDSLEDDMACEQVMTCPKLVCMLKTNPLSSRASISYHDLRDQNFIVISPGSMPYYYDYVRKICRAHGFKPNVARFAQRPTSLVGSLQNNNEVVICDVFLRDIDSPMVKLFPLPDTYSGMIAVWKKDNPNPYIKPYIENLKRNFSEHIPEKS